MAKKKVAKKKASKPKPKPDLTPKDKTENPAPEPMGLPETEAQMRTRIEAEVRAENEKPYENVVKANKLKDGTVKVVIGPGEGARVLQGQVVVKGEDKWIDLCVISPPGAPNIRISAKKKVKELRLMLNNVELEKTKV